MSTRHQTTALAVVLPALVLGACLVDATPVAAQSLAARVSSAREGRVQFSFAPRTSVCGNGRSFISIGTSTYIGTYTVTSDGTARDSCESGPVRVVLERADGAVIGVETYVGPIPAPQPGVTDLGAVRSRDAADYLLSLAARLDGRPGRDAILPAAIADSADVAPGLLAVARDKDRPRDTRRSALSWLARVSEEPAASRRAADVMVSIARDVEEHAGVRQQGLSTLARLENGAGIPALISLSRQAGDDAWLAKEATEAIARSGDPRAREHLRTIVRSADAPEAVLSVAIRGLAREYSTSRDAALLRDVYPRLQTERTRQSVLTSIAEMGGTENARWLLGVAKNTAEKQAVRRQALQSATRAGVPVSELARLYESADQQLRELLLSVYASSGERVAVDRLMWIARNDEDRAMRRRAIQHLSRVDDPRAKALLQELAVSR